MNKLIIIFLLFSSACFAQVKDTISINNVDYEVIIDTITNKVVEHYVIEKETFFEKLYIGSTMTVNYGNFKPELLLDCSEWGKFGVGYDIGHDAWTISAYVSPFRLHKRKDKVNAIYF